MSEKISNSLKRKFQNPESLNSGNKVLSYATAQNYGPSIGIHQGEEVLQRFKIIFSDGRTISIPYAYLPIFILIPDQSLVIRTNDMEVMIKGHNLQKLEALFSKERIEWIKESNTQIPPNEEQLFIANIEVEGNLLL